MIRFSIVLIGSQTRPSAYVNTNYKNLFSESIALFEV